MIVYSNVGYERMTNPLGHPVLVGLYRSVEVEPIGDQRYEIDGKNWYQKFASVGGSQPYIEVDAYANDNGIWNMEDQNGSVLFSELPPNSIDIAHWL